MVSGKGVLHHIFAALNYPVKIASYAMKSQMKINENHRRNNATCIPFLLG
jgi:hypothetical protein